MNKTNSGDELLKPLRFCVFDLETTGGNLKNDRIIEIGMVNIDNLEVVQRKDFLINPDRNIPDFIQKLTNIKQSDVEGSPLITEVIDEILEFIGDRVLVAHNASFDVPFLNAVLRRIGKKELKNKSICTNLMTKYLIPSLMSSNLNYMSQIFNISHTNAHRALDDAEATAKLLLKYLEIFTAKGISKINHLYYPKNRFELDLANFKASTHSNEDIDKKMKTIKCPFIVTIKGSKGIILFAFPSNCTKGEREYITEKLNSLEWETASIRLIGPYSECLIKVNHLFAKLPKDLQFEIAHRIEEFVLDGKDQSYFTKEIQKLKEHDFIFMNHLVPGQYSAYPLISMGAKSSLVFRYPGHKKKLIQYLNSKSNRITSKKIRPIPIKPELKIIIDLYLAKCLKEKREIFIAKKNSNFVDNDQFFKELDSFLAENNNTYDYPHYYI